IQSGALVGMGLPQVMVMGGQDRAGPEGRTVIVRVQVVVLEQQSIARQVSVIRLVQPLPLVDRLSRVRLAMQHALQAGELGKESAQVMVRSPQNRTGGAEVTVTELVQEPMSPWQFV